MSLTLDGQASSTNGKAPQVDDLSPLISIKRVERRTALVPVIGTAPLIVHAWSEKSKQQMLDNQQGRKKQKENRNPEAEYESSMYRLPDGTYAFPALAFKSAIVGGARFYDKSVTMAALKRLLYVGGVGPEALLPLIVASEPKMREDMVRVGMTTDLRYRAQFDEWSVIIPIRYAPSMIDLESVVALVDAGGAGDGVGEWRPEKGGTFGSFQVDDSVQIEELRA